MKRVLAVTGTRREASVLRQVGVTAVAIGGSGAALDAALAAHASAIDAIISFGTGGALDPDLKLGDWVIGSSVISNPSPSGEGLGVGSVVLRQGRLSRTNPTPTPPLKGRGFQNACDQELITCLVQRLPGAQVGPCYADGRLIGDSQEKQVLNRKHGALVADMESHIVAAAATRLGIPFAILRCISDEAGADLPPAIAVAMHPDGSLALGAILTSILTNPGQLPALMRSTARFNRAFASLESGARLAFSQT